MKKQELDNLKKQVREVSRALKSLSDDELTEVLGGTDLEPESANINRQDANINRQDANIFGASVVAVNYPAFSNEKSYNFDGNEAKPANVPLFSKDRQ